MNIFKQQKPMMLPASMFFFVSLHAKLKLTAVTTSIFIIFINRMKKSLLLALAVAGAAIMSSCSKLGSLSADNFRVNPTPLEAIGGEDPATINGIFPEKYMKKKAVVTVTPVLKYEGAKLLAKAPHSRAKR